MLQSVGPRIEPWGTSQEISYLTHVLSTSFLPLAFDHILIKYGLIQLFLSSSVILLYSRVFCIQRYQYAEFSVFGCLFFYLFDFLNDSFHRVQGGSPLPELELLSLFFYF